MVLLALLAFGTGAYYINLCISLFSQCQVQSWPAIMLPFVISNYLASMFALVIAESVLVVYEDDTAKIKELLLVKTEQ